MRLNEPNTFSYFIAAQYPFVSSHHTAKCLKNRTLLHTGHGFCIELLRSHPLPIQWSDVYATKTQKIVLPMNDVAFDIRAQNQTWLVDGLTAMQLSSDLAYQVRPSRQSVREALVVSGHSLRAAHSEPTFWLLSPRTIFRAHLTSHYEKTGLAGEAANALVEHISHGKRLFPFKGAVVRAKRLLVTHAATFNRASIHDIADASAISAFHLTRSFKQQMGLSLHQYRLRLRLTTVIARLSSGERDLPGLAHDQGFCSQSHLSAFFLREVGVTLAQARLAFAPQV